MVSIMTGKQIRLKRIEHDLNLTDFARTMHVSKTWMSLVETEKESGEPLRAKATLYFLSLGERIPRQYKASSGGGSKKGSCFR